MKFTMVCEDEKENSLLTKAASKTKNYYVSKKSIKILWKISWNKIILAYYLVKSCPLSYYANMYVYIYVCVCVL